MTTAGAPADWPQPDPQAAELSARLSDAIRAEIADRGGSVSFARYMEMALYQPGLGYYSAGLAKFGRAGDFVTAPEVSPLFSRTLALQVGEVLSETGGDVLELGAGSGAMAAAVLAELERRDQLPERYRILEVSAHLRQVQQETLAASVPHLLGRVEWLDALPAAPLNGVVLGNEVLDALPVERFGITQDGVGQYRVTAEDGGFGWRLEPAPARLAAAVDELQAKLGARLPVGYQSEINPQLPAWLTALGEALARGVMLWIDYGYPRREYYHPQRHMGTLVCHYRHRGHDDPLILTGLQDITAFVDFSAVADAGAAAGLELLGFTSQAQFLMGAGLPMLMEQEMARAEPEDYLRLAQQAKALTLPGEMGERFKVLALGRGYAGSLAGFSMYDQQGRLG